MKTYQHLVDCLVPTNYQLNLRPNLKNFTFTGHEVIDFRLIQTSNRVTLHAVDLKVTTAKLGPNTPIKISYDKKLQTVSLEFDKQINSGKHQLEIEFQGQLKDNLHGFYRSQYMHNNKKKYLATTQFEATHAREAFVCIDEPAAKAAFEVILTIDKDLTAISNTNITGESVAGPLKTIQFAPTPKMSTYLLAFIIGEFDRVSTTTQRGIEVGVYTTPGKIHQADFALEFGKQVLDFYEQYFNINYPLPKLDMIAIPDFSSGAMENWGAVTYRETAILMDPDDSSLGTKQRVAMVIAHELAHQWFGNLVTMRWWTDLWLNEGFASWVEYLAVDHIKPNWLMWEQFVADDYQQARQLDCLENTHPIEIEVNDPSEINQIFDNISYHKGATVIRMLQHYLGEDDFRRGLQNYLKKYSYSNATTADLWHELEQATNKPVKSIMNTWTKVSGYPIISFDGDMISQNRFYSNPKRKNKSNTVWPIPLQFKSSEDISQPILVDKKSYRMKRRYDDWFKPNSNQSSLVVVNYNATMLGQLALPLKKGLLNPIDRLGIISDSTILNEAGYLDAKSLLELISQYRSETSYIVWDGVLSGLNKLAHIMTDESIYNQIRDFNRDLLKAIYQKLGNETRQDEHHFNSLLRPIVLSSLAKSGDKTVINLAHELFDNHIKGQTITPNMRAFVYTTIGRDGTKSDFEKIRQLYMRAELQEEKRRLFVGLATSKDPILIQQALDMSLSQAVRPSDSIIYLAQIMANRYAKEQAWQFIQSNWKTLYKNFSSSHLMALVPTMVGNAFVTRQKADEIKNFFDSHASVGIERSVAQAIEQILIYDSWRNRDSSAIANYFS